MTLKRKISIIFLILLTLITTTEGCASTNYLFTHKNKLFVHYIDVGQGDSILVQVNNKNLLIDTGPKDHRSNLLKYLKSLHINKLDYVIATHPHDDHIGNMASIIKKYPISKFYAPKISDTSKSYEEMIYALKNIKLKINIIKSGTNSINLGDNTKVYIFSPKLNHYEDMNNYSAVIKITYKHSSFLFAGDAEKEAEEAMLADKDNIKADVIKIGHHGSTSSSTKEFIKKVNPKLAVICVGEDNSFNHPAANTLKILNELNIKILRTDTNGTITLSTDGLKIYYYNKRKEFSDKKLKILFYSSASLLI